MESIGRGVISSGMLGMLQGMLLGMLLGMLCVRRAVRARIRISSLPLGSSSSSSTWDVLRSSSSTIDILCVFT